MLGDVIALKGDGYFVKVPRWLYTFGGRPKFKSSYKYIFPRNSIWNLINAVLLILYWIVSAIFKFSIDNRLVIIICWVLGGIIGRLMPKY